MVKFWGALARHLAQHDPERVFLEVANEPGLDNPLDWYAVEVRVLKAMRERAPRHTLIAGYNMRASKNDWDGVRALTLFPEIADQNVVFTTATSPEPIVTPDVTYPGPHAVLYKDAPGPGRSSVASFDDVRYDDGASLRAKASPVREERPDCRVARQGISCPHHG